MYYDTDILKAWFECLTWYHVKQKMQSFLSCSCCCYCCCCCDERFIQLFRLILIGLGTYAKTTKCFCYAVLCEMMLNFLFWWQSKTFLFLFNIQRIMLWALFRGLQWVAMKVKRFIFTVLEILPSARLKEFEYFLGDIVGVLI